jgi:cell division transport system permease protein
VKAWFLHQWQAVVQAIKRLAITPFGSLLSIAVIGIAFSLPAGVYVVLENLETLAGRFPAEPQLSVFLRRDAKANAITEIEWRLKQHQQVASYRFVSRDIALEQFKESSGLTGIMEGLEKNPLPDAFVITAKTLSSEALDELGTELANFSAVEHVQLDSAWARRLESLLNLGQFAVLMLGFLLSFLLIAVAFNTIRLQILTMRDEIEVAKLIGASDSFIQRPFLYFGAVQGLAGGVAGWLIISLGIQLTDAQIMGLMQLYDLPFRPYHLSIGDTLTLLFFSASLGWAGAWLSVTNYLWKIEPQ